MTTNMIIRFRIVYSKKTEISVGTTYSGSVFCGSDSRGRLDGGRRFIKYTRFKN